MGALFVMLSLIGLDEGWAGAGNLAVYVAGCVACAGLLLLPLPITIFVGSAGGFYYYTLG